MRLTVHIPDELKEEIQRAAHNEHKSMSSLVSEAIRYYLHDRRKKLLGRKVLEMVGESAVTPDVDEELERGRMDDPDRA